MTTVAAWGGGVNSTALVIEWLRRKEPLDLVLFADTMGEKPETYRFRDLFALWLKERGILFHTVKHQGRDPSLEAEVLRLKGLPSIAYGMKRCSLKWKRGPQDVFCNNWQPAQDTWKAGELVVKLIGYDAGERHRMKVSGEDEKYSYRYPLVEWDWGRDDCVRAIQEAELPVPPKSSCFFCPSSRVPEILRLRDEHPELMKRAIHMERNAELQPGGAVGLGRRFSWEKLLERDRRQLRLFEGPPAIPCDCFDGEDDEA